LSVADPVGTPSDSANVYTTANDPIGVLMVTSRCGHRRHTVPRRSSPDVTPPAVIRSPSSTTLAVTALTPVVPGRHDVTVPTPPEVVTALRQAFDRGARIASICSGAFTLAATGLLDGKRATTHLAAAEVFRTTFPAVRLDPDVLYVDEGRVLTSARASAGLDLCLHVVARDHGAAVTAHAARLALAPLHRNGGQSQFILRNRAGTKQIAERTELDDVLAWIEREAHRDITLGDITVRAAVSVRTLNRRFQTETGQTPMQWLTGAGVSPQHYRNTFRERVAG
jgi:transcriptional regulator GlxA family with amidase domain